MLKIEKYIQYLSPSALITAENMPNMFYLNRLIYNKLPKEPQALNAAVGSAFDYYIKSNLMLSKFQDKKHILPNLKKGIETNQDEAFTAGKIALNAYTNVIDLDKFTNVELHIIRPIEGIPIMGKADASTNDPLDTDTDNINEYPFDWKVMGYTSTTSISPPPKYFRLWENSRPRAAHPRYVKDISILEINNYWATQLTTYGWLLGIPIGKPFPVFIDAIIFHNKFVKSIAQYRGIATSKYQEILVLRYKQVWNSIIDGSFIQRLASTKDEDLVWLAAKEEKWYMESQWEVNLL